ncbi:MAG: hypothetical protein IKY26_04080 [Erysipelotrichaceae bacterium]|nr:hypothetical protein [Erysipelotrichaceae bacterium]
MARYTIELRHVIDMFGEAKVKSWFMDYDLSDYLTDEEIAVITARGVWSKDKLAQAIIDHYYMYEIGLETPGLFAHQAKVFMREIMEEKAPLLYSAAIKYDPLVNVDYTESFDRTSGNQSSSNSTSTNNGSGLSVSSDTPQGQISKTAILSGEYASSTSANETENTVKDNTTTSGTGSEEYTKHVKGNSGVSATAQKMIQQYRENIIMINRDIIKDINILFLGVY